MVYVNCRGDLEYMPGMMGEMMKRHGFRMNGMSRIYAEGAAPIETGIPEAVGIETAVAPRARTKDIRFYGEDIFPGNRLFRALILAPDTKAGIRAYERDRLSRD